MENEPMINKYLRQMLEMGGSDLHLSINFPAKARIHGNIQCLDDDVLDADRMEQMLRENDCDYLQGFLFSRPRPEKEFVRFIREHNPA